MVIMRKVAQYIGILTSIVLISTACTKNWLELQPRGTELETNFYQTEEEVFQGLIAVYDVLQWGGTSGAWTMKLGLLNAASDDCYAGGSDASDQPSWVAWDNFTLDPFLGPQQGLWNKSYAGIYRANLLLEKIGETDQLSEAFKNRVIAEAKFLRAYFYFDLVTFFRNVPLITRTLGGDELYNQVQADPADVYAQIEQDLKDAAATFELPAAAIGAEAGRITSGAAKALLGKVILYQNDQSRMLEAAGYLEEVINSGVYDLEPNYGDIFLKSNEFGIESVFEISYSAEQRGGWENFVNGTEGNYNVQFFGMRDYVGPTFSAGWSFCPVTEDLVDFLRGDPRFEHTIIDAKAIGGASYTAGFQNTDYFIRKYAPLAAEKAPDGEPALNWTNNIREMRFADVLLMAAEALVVGGGSESVALGYLNRVRQRVGLQPVSASGQALLDAIYNERRAELATEGHRFLDLVRTGKAGDVLGSLGYRTGTHELLPIPQAEIDITEGTLKQNPNY